MKTLAIAISFVTLTTATASEETRLKQEFLLCDLHASQYVLDDGEGAYCSEVYEKLKKQFFNNDSAALLRWWQEEKRARKPQ